MLNVNVYIDKAVENCSTFIDTATIMNYMYNGEQHKKMKNSLHLCLLNGCKAILLKYGANFGCCSEDDIIQYTINNFNCASGIAQILEKEKIWNLAVRVRNKSYYRQLDHMIGCDLRHFVDFLNEEIRV